VPQRIKERKKERKKYIQKETSVTRGFGSLKLVEAPSLTVYKHAADFDGDGSKWPFKSFEKHLCKQTGQS
jgi:hypothetical protein